MYKKTAFISSLSLVAFALTGCSTPMKFEAQLPEHRPTVTKLSHAMQVARAMKTTKKCQGCVDTGLWSDEVEMIDKVGFDPLKVQQAIRAQKTSSMSIVGDAIDVAGTASDIQGVLNGGAFKGHLPGVGLALTVGGWLLLPSEDDGVDVDSYTNHLKMTYVLPADNKITEREFTSADTPKDEYKVYNAKLFAQKKFIAVQTKAAKDLGFKPVGDIRVHFIKTEDGYRDWVHVWQPLENDKLGCPKVTENSERMKICRVETAPYKFPMDDMDRTFIFEKTTVPKILANVPAGQKRWIAHYGYNRMFPTGLMIDEAKEVKEPDALYHQFAMQLQKHLLPGMTIFVPSYTVNGISTAQAVLDTKGTHYFAVVVPRKGQK